MPIQPRKTKSGTAYLVRVRDPQGQWYPAETYDNLTDAKAAEARLLQQKRKGAKALSTEAKRITVSEYWEVWSVENRGGVSPGWKISQDQMFRDYIKPVLGEDVMADIGTPDIGRVMNKAQQMGRGAQTRKHIYSLLRRMFGDAVEYYEMLAKNPVNAKFHRPKVNEVSRDFLKPQQAMELLEACRDHYLGPAIWLQVLAGMRISEVQALVWKSLDFDAGSILICAAYNNKVDALQEYPKQGDYGVAPMPPMLADYLRTLKRGPEDFVAQGPKGDGKMLSYETYYRALKNFCRKNGLPPMETHELRHTSTELYIEMGASAEDVRRLLNQKSLSATKKYIHRTDGRLNQLAGKMTSLTLVGGTAVHKNVHKSVQKGVGQDASSA